MLFILGVFEECKGTVFLLNEKEVLVFN